MFNTRKTGLTLLLTIFLYTIFYVNLIEAQNTDGSIKQCAKFEEYCQNHWDCCSERCLTHLNRCELSPAERILLLPQQEAGKEFQSNSGRTDCLKIGSICTDGAECCTRRCDRLFNRCLA